MGQNLQEALSTFDHHVPGPAQVERIQAIRMAAKRFVADIYAHVNEGPDRTCAVRKVHEAMMTCNKSIVNEYPEDVR